MTSADLWATQPIGTWDSSSHDLVGCTDLALSGRSGEDARKFETFEDAWRHFWNQTRNHHMRGSLLLRRLCYSSLLSTASPFQPIRKMTTPENPRIIALFDVDGTLTIPRGEITADMRKFMEDLSKKITVGIVGGSDLPKQEEQLGEGIVNVFPYNFSQNGLVAYKNGELLEAQTIAKFLGEDNIKRIVNWTLKYLAELELPIKVCWNTFMNCRSCFDLSVILTFCHLPFSVEHSSNSEVECSTFPPLAAIAREPNVTTMKSSIWKIMFERIWLKP